LYKACTRIWIGRACNKLHNSALSCISKPHYSPFPSPR
jgi:hypothetical protein